MTAINDDGNDSVDLAFAVVKGKRSIDWNQTFSGITYGDAPITLNATATGTDLTVTNHPDTISGLKLWLDASALSTAGTTWSDSSGEGTNATKNGTPSVVTDVQNGHSVMRYAANGYHEWADINNIRTIFWVIRAESNNAAHILGDDNQYHFHNNSGTPPTFWHGGHASANVRNGNLSINGFRGLDGTLVTFASQINEMSIVSLQTTGNVEASRFSDDRAISGRQWKGDLGELLIYTTALSDEQVESVEGYLAHKWGLAAKLPATHNYALGNAIDFHYVSNNPEIVEINGTSAIIRGGGTVTVTAHAPANHGANSATPYDMNITVAKAPLTITGQDLTLTVGNSIPDLNYTISGFKHSDASIGIAANPSGLTSLALWLDASDETSITHTSNAVSQWSDKSGNGKHVAQATADNQPTLTASALNGHSVITSDGNDYFEGSSAYGFGNDFSFFLVASIDTLGSNAYTSVLASTNTGSPHFQIDGGDNSNNNDFFFNFRQVSMGTDKKFASTKVNGPSVYTMVFNDTANTLEAFVDGTSLGTTSYTAAPHSNNKLLVFSNRGKNAQPQGTMAELIGLSSAASSSERSAIEGYLAYKWGLMSNLPSNHSHKTISMSLGPVVTTDANNSSGAGTYYVRPGSAISNKYSFNYVDGELILSNKTEQTIAWGPVSYTHLTLPTNREV